MLRPTFTSPLAPWFVAIALGCSGSTPPAPTSDWPLAVVAEYPQSFRPWDLTVHDVDGDDQVDVLLGGEGVAVLRAQPDGSLISGSTYDDLTSATDFAPGDFNEDGHVDLVIADHDAPAPHFILLLGAGDGTFTPAPESPFVVQAVPHLHTVAAFDFTGDGHLDIVTDSWPESRLVLVPGRGDGTFELPGRPFEVPSAPLQNLRCADLNADGNGDVVTPAHDVGAVTVLLGDGEGGFRPAEGSPVPSMGGFTTLELADMDLDGDIDVVAVHRSDASTEFVEDGVSVLLNDGIGVLSHAPGSPLAKGLPLRSNDLAIGNLDEDKRPEIVVLGETHEAICLVQFDEQGLRVAGTWVSPADIRGVALADLDGDGRSEVLVSDWKGQALRTFRPEALEVPR